MRRSIDETVHIQDWARIATPMIKKIAEMTVAAIPWPFCASLPFVIPTIPKTNPTGQKRTAKTYARMMTADETPSAPLASGRFDVAQPQLGHATAFSDISFPHSLQNMVGFP